MRWSAIIVAGAVGLLAAPTADGAITLVKLPPTLGAYQAFQCPGGTYAETATALGEPKYIVPTSSVITSSRHRTRHHRR